MKRLLGFQSWLVGGALVALATQPVHAAATTITGVRVVPTGSGVRITLNTEGSNVPQVFAINQGNSLRADIVRTQLRLSEGSQFYQQSPAPGIDSIALVPLDANSVRLTVNSSSSQVPAGTISETDSGGIVIDVNTNNGTSQASTPLPSQLETVPGESEQIAQTPDQSEPVDSGPAQNTDQPDVLVPSPEVTIDGVPIPSAQPIQVAPPFIPRAVAPPVGDIAVAESTPIYGDTVDLGTAERVPRLVLRNAPSREVLSLLARAAGLNIVFIDPNPEGDGGGPTVSLDVQNESVQDVFNSVLRITGLQVSRVGRSIYVGENLPTSARNVVSRTLRLNQTTADNAAGFLASLGAEGTQIVSTTTLEDVSGGTDLDLFQRRTETEIRPLTFTPGEDSQAPRVLRGLLVSVDSRTNSITLLGEPQLVETASRYLIQLDLRRRQVAVNVRIINVDLNATESFGTSFSLLAGNNTITNTAGFGLINFGTSQPGSAVNPAGFFGTPATITGSNALAAIANQFLVQLQAQVVSGNAKVLTDPTLVIQEGQTANLELTEEVLTSVTSTTDADTNVTTVTPVLTPAGLLLSVEVERIDDNGFVSINVAPTVSSPDAQTITFTDVNGNAQIITPINTRAVSSGLIRVRDGQTLVIAGIIQESDRTTVRKVPLLGDLPLLGALFRSSEDENTRTEVIVMLTPQILDDSDQSVWGYSYTPSEEVQEIINRSDNPQ